MSYFFTFLLSFLLSLALTFFLRKIGDKYHFFDIAPEDDVLKIHRKPISYLGGLAMALTMLISLLFVVLTKNYLAKEIIAIVIGALPIFALGFWDDLRWKNIPQPKPYRKFICLIVFPLFSASVLLSADIKINFFGFLVADYLLTFLYIFVLVNSINYEDGIDGLAGGSVLLSLIGFFLLAIFLQNEFAGFFSLILSGAICGFLVFNMPPAKIFMGDSGAFFLGYVLSVFTILFSKQHDMLSFIGLVLITGFPVFEGIFTNLRRIANKKSIFLGDRKHLYDKLYLKKKFSIQKTLLICYSIQVIFIIIGLIIFFYGNTLIKT